MSTEDTRTGLVVEPDWELDITSYRGVSIGAIHFYGKLKRAVFVPHYEADGTTQRGWWTGREEVELHREITDAQEVELIEKDGSNRSFRLQYTPRFDTRDDVIKAALGAFEAIRVDGEWLTTGYDETLLAGEVGEELSTPGGTSMGYGSPIKDTHHDFVITLDGATMTLDDFMDLRGDLFGEPFVAVADPEDNSAEE